jgi:hypothetical protein
MFLIFFLRNKYKKEEEEEEEKDLTPLKQPNTIRSPTYKGNMAYYITFHPNHRDELFTNWFDVENH